MNINDYIFQFETIINSFLIVSSYNLNIDKKSEEIAFISGRIDFRDSSVLDFKEFIEASETGVEKYKYSYNYRKGTINIFRYDNAPDPRARHLKTFPHHKHSKDGKLLESEQIELYKIFEKIETFILT